MIFLLIVIIYCCACKYNIYPKFTCINDCSIFAIIFYLKIILLHRQSLNLRFKCFHLKFECMNVNIRNSRFEISRYFVKSFFLTMGFSDGEGLSKLYLELVDAYKKRFVPQNGQVTVLKCSSIWKKMRKSFKTLWHSKRSNGRHQ